MTRKDKPNKVEIEGAVMSGTCASFIVNGTTIPTDAATQFSEVLNVVPGALGQVKGSTLADMTALRSRLRSTFSATTTTTASLAIAAAMTLPARAAATVAARTDD